MSLSRTSTLALALAAGLAAPASAATTQWTVVFTASTNEGGLPGGGTGSFTVEAPAPDGPPVPLGTWSFTFTLEDANGVRVVDGATYTQDTPTVAGQGPRFAFRSGGSPFLDMSNVFADGNALSLGDPVFGNDFLFKTPDCQEETPAAACGLLWEGSYTLTPVDTDPDPSVIPLPATAALLPLGLAALGALRRRRGA